MGIIQYIEDKYEIDDGIIITLRDRRVIEGSVEGTDTANKLLMLRVGEGECGIEHTICEDAIASIVRDITE